MGQSTLRKETTAAKDGSYAPNGATAYLMILNAVEQQDGLLHGKLDGPYGDHCAIGSYFAVNPKNALPTTVIDEVAAVNDSMPHKSARIRKLRVMRWLRWRLKQAGMPGFERAKP